LIEQPNPDPGRPLLLECDASGRILSMSDSARAAFGPVHHLTDAMRVIAPHGHEGLLRLSTAAKFLPLLQHGDRLWVSADLNPGGRAIADPMTCHEARALVEVQSHLLQHYFRLQNAERQLSARIRMLRRSPASALMQVERERERLGIELHSGVGQTLAAIRLQVEVIASQFRNPPSPVEQALARISTLTIEALDYVRSVAKRLHPPEWQRLTLGAALAQLWEMSGVPETYEASIDIEALPHEPMLEVKVLMYRAAQEGLSNLRHARATRVRLSLLQSGETLVLTIEDNGIGFDPERLFSAVPVVASGLGLRSIREQAAGLGGGLIVQSSTNGTKLEVILPFA
jgi:signal transduction histidine kinase